MKRIFATALSLSCCACAVPVVSVEVLPPRGGVSCTAPGVDASAFGRGLFDAKTSDFAHGSYRADLRMVVTGTNARVDGIDVRITRDGDEVDLLAGVPTGDVLLVGEGDDVRKAVVENVELLPRKRAQELRDDSGIDDVDFATLLLEISPVVLAADASPAASTFALDVCNGCLVDEPPADACPGGAVGASVCRVGQDAPSWSCVPGGAP